MSTLHDIVRSGTVTEAGALIASGVEINAPDKMKRTALHIASWKGNSDMVRLLIRCKASCIETAMDGFTALHFAAQSGSCKCCELLVEKQKSLLVARVSKGSKTALHLAIAKGNMDMVQCLVALGSDIMAKTAKGQSCLELSSGKQEIYDFLKEKISESIDRKSKILKPPSQAQGPSKSSSDVDVGDPDGVAHSGQTAGSAAAGEPADTSAGHTQQSEVVESAYTSTHYDDPSSSSSNSNDISSCCRSTCDTRGQIAAPIVPIVPVTSASIEAVVMPTNVSNSSESNADICDMPTQPKRKKMKRQNVSVILSHLESNDDYEEYI